MTKKALALLLALTLLLALAACAAAPSPAPDPAPDRTEPPADSSPDPEPPEPAEPPAPEPEPYEIADPKVMPEGGVKDGVAYAAYDGLVEHLFFHPVIAYPELAFDGDAQEKGLDDFMVTVDEFNKILSSVYERGYVLVDIADVWSETTDEAGNPVMVRNTLYLPEGKKPVVFSYDDTNYYPYMLENGFAYKLVIGEDGKVWSWGIDPQGNEVVSRDLDAIPVLDKFVEEHPDFSPFGAKACLSLTGYEGILGYRTQTDTKAWDDAKEANRQAERRRCSPSLRSSGAQAGPSAATPGATSGWAAATWVKFRRTRRSGWMKWAAWWVPPPFCFTPTASGLTATTGSRPARCFSICSSRGSGCSAPWAWRASAT